MRDRTAQTEPLTIGQQLVARWEGTSSGWSEPADLAEAIDDAILAATLEEREACAIVANEFAAKTLTGQPRDFANGAHWVSMHLPLQIRNRT